MNAEGVFSGAQLFVHAEGLRTVGLLWFSKPRPTASLLHA
jgi:hypothetical protein